MQTFHQPADAILVDAVRAEITAQPSYGYRRSGALVNRTRALMGLTAIYHKRFYRVMKANSLLLASLDDLPHCFFFRFRGITLHTHQLPPCSNHRAKVYCTPYHLELNTICATKPI